MLSSHHAEHESFLGVWVPCFYRPDRVRNRALLQITTKTKSTPVLIRTIQACAFLLLMCARALSITCGDVVGPNDVVVLDRDLGPCPRTALTVNSGTLDLNGFTVTCAEAGPGEGYTGVFVTGRRSQVRGGTIRGCDGAVVLSGVGSRIEGVTAERYVLISGRSHHITTSSAAGFGVSGRGHILDENMGCFSVDEGSTRILLSNNLATGCRNGFDIRGRGNRLSANTATDNSLNGFSLTAGGTLIGNSAKSNAQYGIYCGGNNGKCTLRDNNASGNLVGISIIGGRVLGGRSSENNKDGIQIISGTLVDGVSVVGNGGDGIAVRGNHVSGRNSIRGNQVLQNREHGIHIRFEEPGARRTAVRNNSVSGHLSPFFDLADDQPLCGLNRWGGNTFGTRSQDCIK